MLIAALVIAILALLVSTLVALSVMELVAATNATAPAQPEDRLEPFELPERVVGTPASDHGLPAAIDGTDMHVVLFVSPRCQRCGELAASFGGRVPAGVTVAITASDIEQQRRWASDHGLPMAEVLFDADRGIVDSLGVSSSPTAVGFGGGKVVFAARVGGPAALAELLRSEPPQPPGTPRRGTESEPGRLLVGGEHDHHRQ